MESPLEVLSRAATMVETTDRNGDGLLGGVSDSYEVGGGKELATRSLKADRLKERQDITQVLHVDKDHAASIHARKTVTISTQTQYSSFKGEAPPYPGPPPGPPPAYFAPHGDLVPGDGYPGIHQGYRPPPPPPPPLPPVPHISSSSSPPSSSDLVDLSRSSSDVQNAPLNLSLSSGSGCVSPSSATVRQPPRPSVITCTSISSSSSSSSSVENSPLVHQNGYGSHNGHSSPNGGNTPVSDPAIEEHFRRSLGRSYEDSIPKTTPAITTATDQSNVSITESVDDHFAKALGDSTWKAIKSQNDTTMDVFTSSVDDHFAKALGATTWRRIKAETEHSETINNNSSGYSTSSAAATSPSGSSLSATVAS